MDKDLQLYEYIQRSPENTNVSIIRAFMESMSKKEEDSKRSAAVDNFIVCDQLTNWERPNPYDEGGDDVIVCTTTENTEPEPEDEDWNECYLCGYKMPEVGTKVFAVGYNQDTKGTSNLMYSNDENIQEDENGKKFVEFELGDIYAKFEETDMQPKNAQEATMIHLIVKPWIEDNFMASLVIYQQDDLDHTYETNWYATIYNNYPRPE